MTIKAIPTTYRGIQMRSKLEARAAAMLDRWEVKWVYEAEGFDLDGVWYLPDFWLPELKAFLEIKGTLDDSLRKPEALARHVPYDTVVLLASAEDIQEWEATRLENGRTSITRYDRVGNHDRWEFVHCGQCGRTDVLREGRSHCHRIYLAGKVRGSQDWRLGIVPALREWTSERDDGWYSWPTVPSRLVLDGEHSYLGPYFFTNEMPRFDPAWDEANLASHLAGNRGYKAHDCSSSRRDEVAQDCLTAIARSSLVFGWLDDVTAYGTLFELGVAWERRQEHQDRRFVYVGGPDNKINDEMWFAEGRCARARGRTPREALRFSILSVRYGGIRAAALLGMLA